MLRKINSLYQLLVLKSVLFYTLVKQFVWFQILIQMLFHLRILFIGLQPIEICTHLYAHSHMGTYEQTCSLQHCLWQQWKQAQLHQSILICIIHPFSRRTWRRREISIIDMKSYFKKDSCRQYIENDPVFLVCVHSYTSKYIHRKAWKKLSEWTPENIAESRQLLVGGWRVCAL